MKFGIILLYLLGCSVKVFGVNDSIKNKPIELQLFTPMGTDSNSHYTLDTSLTRFYSLQDDGFVNVNSLGNYGLASSSLLFEKPKYGFNSDDKIFLNNASDDLIIYDAQQPFARVSYFSGPKKLQSFRVLFTQNIMESLNLTFEYETFGATGTYINQNTKGNNFSFQSSFIDSDSRYNFFVKFDVNSGIANENGGIKSDSIYSALTKLSPFDPENNKLKVQVWQEGALNHYDYRNLEVVHVFSFGKKVDKKLDKNGFSLVVKNNGFYEDVWYDDNYSDSSYYSTFNININDSADVFDKSHVFGFENTGLLKFSFKGTGMVLFSGVDLNLYEYQNYFRSKDLNQIGLNFGFSGLSLQNLRMHGSYQMGLLGFNNDGYKGELGFRYFVFNGLLNLKYELNAQSTLPRLKYIDYSSSIQDWENDFSYVSSIDHLFKIESDSIDLDVSAKFYSVHNFVYISNLAVPVQHGEKFNGYEVNLRKGFKLGNFYLDLDVLFQDVNEAAPVNLAKVIGKVGVYHQREIFHEAMELKYGFEYWQTSSYHANYYAPFSRSFVLQNQYAVGNYPYIDFFVSARIKGAQGFLKFQNVGQIFFRENYMMVPFYPLQDFGLSFGIRWDFFN